MTVGLESMHIIRKPETVSIEIGMSLNKLQAFERVAEHRGISLESALGEAIRNEVAPGTLMSAVKIGEIRQFDMFAMPGWRAFTVTMSKNYSDAIDVRRALRGDSRSRKETVVDAIDSYIAKATAERQRHLQLTRHGH